MITACAYGHADYLRTSPIRRTENMADENLEIDAVELATELTVAWLANPNTRTSADDVPAF